MQEAVVRDALRGDFAAVCELNRAEEQQTSAMSEERLEALAELACYHKVACVGGKIAAFLLAMRDGARYENDNFSWFAARYPTFIYVDRIVVSSVFQGMRIGRLLYEDLFRFARGNAISVLACEYNIEPPNEPSRIFHDKFGFTEQGTQWVAGGAKRVSLQVARV